MMTSPPAPSFSAVLVSRAAVVTEALIRRLASDPKWDRRCEPTGICLIVGVLSVDDFLRPTIILVLTSGGELAKTFIWYDDEVILTPAPGVDP